MLDVDVIMARLARGYSGRVILNPSILIACLYNVDSVNYSHAGKLTS